MRIVNLRKVLALDWASSTGDKPRSTARKASFATCVFTGNTHTYPVEYVKKFSLEQSISPGICFHGALSEGPDYYDRFMRFVSLNELHTAFAL